MIKNFKMFDNIDKFTEIIKSEIKLSEEKFKLKIEPEDQEKEIDIIIKTFGEYDFSNGISSEIYQKLFNEIVTKVNKLLDKQLNYYFCNTPEGETKTRYNCHLHSVIFRLFILLQ